MTVMGPWMWWQIVLWVEFRILVTKCHLVLACWRLADQAKQGGSEVERGSQQMRRFTPDKHTMLIPCKSMCSQAVSKFPTFSFSDFFTSWLQWFLLPFFSGCFLLHIYSIAFSFPNYTSMPLKRSSSACSWEAVIAAETVPNCPCNITVLIWFVFTIYCMKG